MSVDLFKLVGDASEIEQTLKGAADKAEVAAQGAVEEPIGSSFGDVENEELRRALQEDARERAEAREAGSREGKEFLFRGGKAITKKDPLRTARLFVGLKYFHDAKDVPALVHWQGGWWSWTGEKWVEKDEGNLVAEIARFLDPLSQNNDAITRGWSPEPHDLGRVMKMLATVVDAGAGIEMPGWRGQTLPFGLTDAEGLLEVVPLKNGLFHLVTREFIAHTPEFFNGSVLDFEYDREAKAPRFEEFLKELWPEDEKGREMALRVIGLCMTFITKYQKMFMLIGPPRSGKGTIARLIKALVGSEAYKGTSVSVLGDTFGMAELINARVAVLPDIRLSSAGWGRADAAMERMLAISGEDVMSVNRKNQKYWNGTLRVKFILMSNHLPAFEDDSGAFASRFILFELVQSWLGKEDVELDEKLRKERSGIFNLAVGALARLRADGVLRTPPSGEELAKNFTALTQAIKGFIEDECILGPNEDAVGEALLERYIEWAKQKGYRARISIQEFLGKLKAAYPHLIRPGGRARTGTGRRLTVLQGIGLRPRPRNLNEFSAGQKVIKEPPKPTPTVVQLPASSGFRRRI
jgi:putative DNA primase/helicase